ncbi:MAG: DUF3471 domain-containing protein, partial [Vicinamibacterales bacterium]
MLVANGNKTKQPNAPTRGLKTIRLSASTPQTTIRPPGNPEDIAVKIAAEVIGDPVHNPPVIAVPADVLDTYVGRYQIAPGSVRTITREGTRMFSQRDGGETSEIVPIGATEFTFKDSFQRLSFEQDSSGRVVRVVSRTLDGTPQVAERIW